MLASKFSARSTNKIGESGPYRRTEMLASLWQEYKFRSKIDAIVQVFPLN